MTRTPGEAGRAAAGRKACFWAAAPALSDYILMRPSQAICFQQKAKRHGGDEAAVRRFLKIRRCLFFKKFGVLHSNSFACNLYQKSNGNQPGITPEGELANP
ncbi:MAG: hypothetical protein LBP38_05105 [Desulfovibrio sp.]|nr:hypothetical protein [Desulfovibrio sp.]